ncbi:hypothetical protein B0H34DRAFT_523156 [Crassisporium funariophilum]|nr:hypothetical protein B0H34DRAFT_523156 [Crassisporium funariophilum]
MVHWCIDELRYKAKLFAENGGHVTVFNGDVVKSDVAVNITIRSALKAAVSILEVVPKHAKDWHPGSDNQVLDLVHPSLFPLVYGQSRILKDDITTLDDCITKCGAGKTLAIPPEEETILTQEKYQRYISEEIGELKPFSRKFQWLPCEVDISGPHDTVRITSYINNLHPRLHKRLYTIIEKVISQAIPLWNTTLTPQQCSRGRIERIVYDSVTYEQDEDDFSDSEGPQQEEDENDDIYNERRKYWIKEVRTAMQPEPESFTPPKEPEKPVNLRTDFGHRGLQIIVKLANIHLTPDNPTYKGGSWHVEGQMNEHICATALYYYDNENITDSRIAFRQQTETNIDHITYEQGERSWLREIFGCEDEGEGTQEVGSVETVEGRLLAFPNILQHQVQPFKLADASKPGHRKILALFLVDPGIRIISTANIPCQRRDWWAEAVKTDGGLRKLPLELQDHVLRQVDEFPIGIEEANQLRLELMQERRRHVISQRENFECQQFNLCEH